MDAPVSAAQANAAQAVAPVRPLITAKVDNAVRFTLPGSHHPLAQPQFDVGPLEANMPLERMILVLRAAPEQEHRLATLLDSQQSKGSKDYHQWMTPDEFGRHFGAAPQDIQQAAAWLQQQGFTVGPIARGGRSLEFSGSVAQVEAAFQTQMRRYLIAGEPHVANSSDISIPAALAPAVRGVVSLHNFFSRSMISGVDGVRRNEQGKLERVHPGVTDGAGNHFLAPGDFAKIYNTAPLIAGGTNGSGQTIAIVARSNINLSDVQTFQTAFALPANPPNIILDGTDPGTVPGDDVEASLDVEWSGAVAPNATIDIVVSASTQVSDGVDLSAFFIVNQNLAPILSESFGNCEVNFGGAGTNTENAFLNALWEQAAAQGISVFVSSGDSGAADCDNSGTGPTGAQAGLGVSGTASTPFNTAVGGTEFNESISAATTFWNPANGAGLESAIGYIPEKIWNDSCSPGDANSDCTGKTFFNLAAGGGGVSTLYTKPSWQTLNIPGALQSQTMRSLPDVSLTASADHVGYLFCFSGDTNSACSSAGGKTTFGVVGGTSASSPSFAGIMALVDQKLGSRQGLANYVLYPLAAAETFANCLSNNQTTPATPSATCVFNDLTTGNNGVPGNDVAGGATGFPAGAGFDLGSGLGSVNAANLVKAWAAATFQGSATNVSATANGNPLTTITHGQAVSITVNVQKAGGGAGPTGDVAVVTDFQQPGIPGSPTVGALTLSGGTATATTSSLPGGTYNLLATYPGDGTFAGSASNKIPVIVTPEPSLVALAAFTQTLSNVNTVTVTFGTSLQIDSQVTGASQNGFGTGTVTFTDTTNGTTSALTGALPLNAFGNVEISSCTSGPICLMPGMHTINASYSGDNSFAPGTNPASQAVIVNVLGIFQFAANVTTTATVPAGSAATYNLNLTTPPPGDGNFIGAVALTCTGAPAGTTCTVNPATANLNSTVISVPVVVTVATTTSARLAPPQFRGLPLVFAGVFAGLLCGVRRRPKQALLMVLAVFMIAGISSCGGGGGNGGGGGVRAPTKATLTVTGTNGTQSTSQALTLTITH